MESDISIPELYFLIARFLAQSDLRSAQTLREELNERGLYPSLREDTWTGKAKHSTFDEVAAKYRHVTVDYLPILLQRLIRRERELAGCQTLPISLLSKEWGQNPHAPVLQAFPTAAIASSSKTAGKTKMSVYHTTINKIKSRNILTKINDRQLEGRFPRNISNEVVLWSRYRPLCRTVGHSDPVYCLDFDKSGTRIITGADDHLLKIWSSTTGVLLKTLRGHASPITDISIDPLNRYLASGSDDKTVRIWELDGPSIGSVDFPEYGRCAFTLNPLSSEVTIVLFSPNAAVPLLLIGTKNGKSIFYNSKSFTSPPQIFSSTPGRSIKSVLASSWRGDGKFVICAGEKFLNIYKILSTSVTQNNNSSSSGNANESIDIIMSGMTVKEILKRENSCLIDFVATSNGALSVCNPKKKIDLKDIRCCCWSPKGNIIFVGDEGGQCILIHLSEDETLNFNDNHLKMEENMIESVRNRSFQRFDGEDYDLCDAKFYLLHEISKEEFLTTGNFTGDGKLLVFASSLSPNNTSTIIRIADAYKGVILHTLTNLHMKEVFTIVPHPICTKLILSAGYDGKMILLDASIGKVISVFSPKRPMSDAKFNATANMIAAVDIWGGLYLYGCGRDRQIFAQTPSQQFFSTDYSPILLTDQDYVLDANTRQPPHLMPQLPHLDINLNVITSRVMTSLVGVIPKSFYTNGPFALLTCDWENYDRYYNHPLLAAQSNKSQTSKVTLLDDDTEITKSEKGEKTGRAEDNGDMFPNFSKDDEINVIHHFDNEIDEGMEDFANDDASYRSDDSANEDSEEEFLDSDDEEDWGKERSIPIVTRRHNRNSFELRKSTRERRGKQRGKNEEYEEKDEDMDDQDEEEEGEKEKVRVLQLETHKYPELPSWITTNSPSLPSLQQSYVPQVGDRVAYLVQGHRQYIDSYRPTAHLLSNEGISSSSQSGPTSKRASNRKNTCSKSELTRVKMISSSELTNNDFSLMGLIDNIGDNGYCIGTILDIEYVVLDKHEGHRRGCILTMEVERSDASENEEHIDANTNNDSVDKSIENISIDESIVYEVTEPMAIDSNSETNAQNSVNSPPNENADEHSEGTGQTESIGNDNELAATNDNDKNSAGNNANEADQNSNNENNSSIESAENNTDQVIKNSSKEEQILNPENSQKKTGNKTKKVYKFQYHPLSVIPDFLIEFELFERSIHTIWRGKKIKMYYTDEGKYYYGKVVDQLAVDPEHYPLSPWECIEVKWDDVANEQVSFLNPWEISLDEGENTESSSSQTERQDHEYVERFCYVLDEVIKSINELSSKNYELSSEFIEAVDLGMYPLYWSLIAHPIHLNMIKDRCKNRYYRTIDHLINDIKLLKINAATFNEEGSELIANANTIVDTLIDAVVSAEAQVSKYDGNSQCGSLFVRRPETLSTNSNVLVENVSNAVARRSTRNVYSKSIYSADSTLKRELLEGNNRRSSHGENGYVYYTRSSTQKKSKSKKARKRKRENQRKENNTPQFTQRQLSLRLKLKEQEALNKALEESVKTEESERERRAAERAHRLELRRKTRGEMKDDELSDDSLNNDEKRHPNKRDAGRMNFSPRETRSSNKIVSAVTGGVSNHIATSSDQTARRSQIQTRQRDRNSMGTSLRIVIPNPKAEHASTASREQSTRNRTTRTTVQDDQEIDGLDQRFGARWSNRLQKTHSENKGTRRDSTHLRRQMPARNAAKPKESTSPRREMPIRSARLRSRKAIFDDHDDEEHEEHKNNHSPDMFGPAHQFSDSEDDQNDETEYPLAIVEEDGQEEEEQEQEEAWNDEDEEDEEEEEEEEEYDEQDYVEKRKQPQRKSKNTRIKRRRK